MSLPLPQILAQVETDLRVVERSGISEVSTEEWLLAGATFVASIVLAAVARRLIDRVLRRFGAPAVRVIAGRLVAFLIVVVGFFYALTSIDVAVGPLLGGLGILGIAIAFALQDVLANFAAGVILQAKRPIRVGDQIVSNEYEGQVEDVDFRAVRIRTFDGEEVFLPNSSVLHNPVTNWTLTPTRRTTLEVGVAYDTDLALAQRTLVEAVGGVEGVSDAHGVEAYVYEFGESSINFAVRFWHGATILEMWRARDGAAQAAKRGLDAAGIRIPFPQRTVWFGPGSSELTIAPRGGGSGASPPT